MIINEDIYECPKCRKLYFFNTAKKPYTTNCNDCKCGLIFLDNADRNTDLAEKAKNTPPYDPTKDPNNPYYIPVIKCPTCQSTNVKKIGTGERVASVAMMGIFSKKINKSFKCNSCGYTW